MECRLDVKKGSGDRPPFMAVEKKVLTEERQRSVRPDKFRDDKRGLSYSDFHREITKQADDVCPKRLENHLKSRVGRTASGERDLVKYRSYVPRYVKKVEKLEEKDVKASDFGSGDLRNRQSGDTLMDKHTRSSLSNTSTSSSVWTDESSTGSSRGMWASPLSKKISHPPLQFYLMSSKPGDCFQECEPTCDNGDTSKSRSYLPGHITEQQQRDSTRRDGKFHQSPPATAFQHNEKKVSDLKVVPKTRASNLDSLSTTRVISKNLLDDFKKKGDKLDERIRNPRVHDLFGKEKPAAIFVPRIVSQKQFVGLSKFYDSKLLLAERVAEINRKEFPEKLAYGKSAVMDLDAGSFRREADGSKPFLKRISFLSSEKNSFLSERSRSAPRSRKAESSPSRSRTLERSPPETLPRESDKKSAKVVPERARSISPFRRLSFSIGKSRKNSNAEDAQTPPHLSTALISSQAGLNNTSSSSFDKTSVANRGRSSPLRRLLEPLMKPKVSHSCRSPEPSQKAAPSSHQKHILSDEQPSPSTVQALFHVTSKNDQPLFTFAVDKEQSITAATIRKQTPSEKEDYGHKYTFFTVQEVQKKNGHWMNQSRKMQSQDYTSNIVAQMRVSGSKPPAGECSVDNHLTREFVLFATESQRANELAAMVIKIPNTTDMSSTTLGDCFEDVNTTVILPSGIHSLPHKGGPSSLIQRWKSGGSCDCGGWDMACNLKILTNQHNCPRNPSPSTSDTFKLFSKGGLEKNQQFLSFSPYREGVYAVEYDTSLSLLQAFSICIAVNEGRNPTKTMEPNSTRVDNAYGEMSSSIQKERMKSFSGPVEGETSARYHSQPPLSPVGRA